MDVCNFVCNAMASIFRKPGSPYFFAAFRDALGRRCQRTTKTNDSRIAKRLAMEWEKAAEDGRSGVLTEAACRRVLSDLHKQTSGKPLNFFTVKGWFEDWLANRVGTAAERTLERYEGTCGNFLEALEDRAKLPLAALTATDLRQYRDTMREQGHSVTTCNQSLKILSGPLEEARKQGLIPVNPAHGVKALKDTEKKSREAFTVEQLRALLAATRGTDWEGCILLGSYCGLRLMDAANLEWSSIDLEEALATVNTGKTGATVTVPLSPELLNWLRSQPRGIGKAPVLPSLYGKRGPGKSGLSMAFKRIMERAGVVGKIARQGRGEGRTTSTLSFHSTRHFFVSSLAANGVPADVRQRLAGHSDARTHAVYASHEMESIRAAVAGLPSLLSQG